MSVKNATKFIAKVSRNRSLKRKVFSLFEKNKGREIEIIADNLNLKCTYKEFIKAFYREKHEALSEIEMKKIRAAGEPRERFRADRAHGMDLLGWSRKM